MALGPEQQGLLQQARLRGLVRARWPQADLAAGNYPHGATGLDGGTGWVLATETGPRAGGGALTWATAKHVDHLHLLVEANEGHLARVVSRFSRDVDVWTIDGTELIAAEAAPPPGRDDVVGPAVDAFGAPAAELDQLRAAGLELVAEDGVLHVEVLGLEVGRFTHHPTLSEDSGSELAHEDGTLRLESGVGRFDREMSALMYAQMAPVEAVLSAAEFVSTHRRAGAPPHPLRDLGRERWLRRTLLDDPSPLGLDSLQPIWTTLPRPNVRDPWPALALGSGPSGPAVVVCTVGIDLDAIPLAADTAAVVDAGAELVVVGVEPLPPSLRGLVDDVRAPSRSVVVAAPWAGDGGR